MRTVVPRLGEFEQLVLLALLRLDEAYGVSVWQEITRRTGRSTSFGTVYTTLVRLEHKGLMFPRVGEPTPERGGRRKKYYEILPAGRRVLQRSLRDITTMARGLDTTWDAT